MPVTVAKPERREVTVYREFPATLVGSREVEIRARVRGILSLAKGARPDFAGNVVEEQDPLFVIEPDSYAQATRAAAAAVDRAKAVREQAKNRADRVSSANAGANRAVSQLDEEGAQADLAEATAAVAQAEAQLEEARITEGYTRITAPVTGRISRLYVDPGNLVGANESTLLATIIEESSMLAYFEVPERPLIRFLERRDANKTTDPVYQADIRLKLADGSTYEHPGKIDYIENQVDPSTRTAKVRAVFPNPDAKLASGLYGLVGYPAGPDPADPAAREALLVPSTCVLRDLGGDFVWVVDDANTVHRKAVTTGDSVEKPVTDPNQPVERQTVVLKGLDGSENVIVSGLQRARDGAVVAPQAAAN
nr:efflux RND transporter periplasmic adaptor subunit [Luteolibacter marinus]